MRDYYVFFKTGYDLHMRQSTLLVQCVRPPHFGSWREWSKSENIRTEGDIRKFVDVRHVIPLVSAV